MYKRKRHLLVVLLFFCLFVKVRAQITANPTGGCAPLSVQFSGPAGASNILWNFGALGTTTISNPNPIFASTGTYPVTYTAIVGGSPVSYSTSITVGNPPSANYSFQIPASHCLPLTASFVATGAAPGSTYSWAYGDLTAVGTGSAVTHTYVVPGSFVPVVIVTDAVTGCTAVVAPAGNNTINVSALPNLNINSSAGLVGCVPPFVTNFTGSTSTSGSPLGGGLNYSWQITTGTPASGAGANIGPVTFGVGNHSVVLTATDNNACTNSISVVATVVNPTLVALVASTVCINAIVQATVTSPQNQVDISASTIPGVFSSTLIPNVANLFTNVCTFTQPGPQTMVFSVSASGVCPPFSVSKNVFVEQVVASFTTLPPYTSCSATMLATVVNQSSVNSGSPLTYSWWPSWGGISYWNASPNPSVTTNTNQNVTFTLSAGSQNPFTIYWTFNPVITLLAQSSNGCNASAILSDFFLTRTTARFTKNRRDGCAPLVVNFRDTTYTATMYPVNSFTWNGGNGTPATISTSPQITYTYTTPGIYYPSFTVQTIGGCTDIFTDTVYVSSPPTVSATVPSSVCAGVPITLTLSGNSTTSPPGAIDHWHISTDENYFSGCITDNTPTFPFSHVGTQTISINAYQWGCGTTVTPTSTIEVKGPYGKFVTINHCTGNRKRVDFEVHLQDVATATLNFGDNTAPQLINGTIGSDYYTSFGHNYATTGVYTVTLTSSNLANGCGNRTFTRKIYVREVQAKITHAGQPIPALPAAMACTKSNYRFSGLTSVDNVTSCLTGYKWWLQGPGFNSPPLNCTDGVYASHAHGTTPHLADPNFARRDTFRVAGIYTISLEVKDENGCADTAKVQFRISNAVPVFTFNANPLCSSAGTIQISNTTQSSLVPPDIITNYTFSFGNGNVATSTNPVFNPINAYAPVAPPSQTLQVMAIAVNQLNCRDTTIHVLQINNPQPGLMTSNFYPCIPLGQSSNAVPFTAMSGYNTYSFTTGTPTNSPVWQALPNFNNIIRYYNTPGIYMPTLTVVDAAGCKATNGLTITALGQPTAVIKNLGVSGYCVPAKIRLVDSSKTFISPITNYQWSYGNFTSPGNITDTVLENILPTPGSYTLTLITTVGGNASCPSSAAKIINVFDTKAEFEIDKTEFCLGDQITVKAKGLKDVYSWKWFFGDLVPQPIIYNTPFASNPIVYTYATYPPGSANGKTTIFLKAVSDNSEGCVVTKSIDVQVIKIDADFKHKLDLYRHCLSKVADVFTTTTANPLNLFFNTTWNFGTTPLQIGDSSKFIFPQAGVYNVTLTVQDTAYSCKSTAIKQMTILPLPSADIWASDSLVCPIDTFTIRITGSASFTGKLKATVQPKILENYTLPSGNSFSLPLTTTITTNYKLTVVDTNNCESPVDSILVKVPDVPTQINTSTVIVIGQTVTLNAPDDAAYSYNWSPETNFLSDTTIANPICKSFSTIFYTVTLVDEPKRCWAVPSTFTVIVLPVTSIDVPSAFTPNGDGINDVIFPDGWGIKRLKYFRIYNRWGQLIFETDVYKQGWDGTYLGQLQNMDTYVYQVEAETYIDDPKSVSQSGTIKLIR